MRDRTRSHFTALNRVQKTQATQAATTLAQQHLPRTMGGSASMPSTAGSGKMSRAGGTYNGRGKGTSPGDGVELMSQMIANRAAGPAKGARPANQSLPKEGSATAGTIAASRDAKAHPLQRTYMNTGELNQTGNARAGQAFSTFTVAGKTGEYHEYVDPKTGKKTTKYVKGK